MKSPLHPRAFQIKTIFEFYLRAETGVPAACLASRA